MQIEIEAPAKINLFLRVLKKRKDNFHNLESVFQSLSLSDRVIIRSLKRKTIKIRGRFDFPPENNTAFRAALIFQKTLGRKLDVEISIIKNIPAGAGLGGGSSDAAAVLKGLNYLHDFPFSLEELRSMGAEIGSDVPFFIGHTAAFVTGRGELIQSAAIGTDYNILLVYPGFPISTGSAYQWLIEDETSIREIEQPLFEDICLMYSRPSVKTWYFYNSFQNTIEKRFPLVKYITGRLLDGGAITAQISGSGSSVFGIFSGKDDNLSKFHGELKHEFSFVKITHPLARECEPVIK